MAQFIQVCQYMPGDPQELTARPLAIMNKLVSDGKNSIKETALVTLCDIGKFV